MLKGRVVKGTPMYPSTGFNSYGTNSCFTLSRSPPWPDHFYLDPRHYISLILKILSGIFQSSGLFSCDN